MWILKNRLLEEAAVEGSASAAALPSASTVTTDTGGNALPTSDASDGDSDSEDFVANEGLASEFGEEDTTQAAEDGEQPDEDIDFEKEGQLDTKSKKPDGEKKDKVDGELEKEKTKADGEAAETKDATEKSEDVDEKKESETEAEVKKEAPTQEQMQEVYNTVLQELESSYSLTEDEGQAILAQPEVELPKRMAKMHMNILYSVMAGMQRNLPNMLHNATELQTTIKSANEQFYTQWPKLKETPEYRETATRLAVLYRQNNPTATSEQVIKEAGLAAMLHHRLPLPADFVQQAPIVDVPHKSAGAAAGIAPVSGPNKNEFTELAREDDDMDFIR